MITWLKGLLNFQSECKYENISNYDSDRSILKNVRITSWLKISLKNLNYSKRKIKFI